MISDRERESRDYLFKLMQENPELPVIPFVDGEVVAGDDFGAWMGSWGVAHADEYLIPPQDYEPVIFKSDDDIFDALEKVLPGEEFDALPELLILVPVLYLIGVGLKKSQSIDDRTIPLILGGCGVLLAAVYVLATAPVSGWQSGFGAMFTAITQGILCAGCSVYVHQLLKQGKE